MAFINPELVALARVKINFISGSIDSCSYEYSNGLEAVEVPGSLAGSPPIFIDTRPGAEGIVLFLTDPVQPGNPGAPPSQAGIKATFDNVSVSSPTNPLPVQTMPNAFIFWQYGDYTLAGATSPVLASTPYAGVNPMKALRFRPQAFAENDFSLQIDVSVFKNPMTLYK